jgi:hypothetical protein
VARRKRPAAPIEAPWWCRTNRVPDDWPGGFDGWQADCDAWFDAHPEAEEAWVQWISTPIYKPIPGVPDGET